MIAGKEKKSQHHWGGKEVHDFNNMMREGLRQGQQLFNFGRAHVEIGMPTPEDHRMEELWEIEKLMSEPPVPLRHIGRAHNKARSPGYRGYPIGAMPYAYGPHENKEQTESEPQGSPPGEKEERGDE